MILLPWFIEIIFVCIIEIRYLWLKKYIAGKRGIFLSGLIERDQERQLATLDLVNELMQNFFRYKYKINWVLCRPLHTLLDPLWGNALPALLVALLLCRNTSYNFHTMAFQLHPHRSQRLLRNPRNQFHLIISTIDRVEMSTYEWSIEMHCRIKSSIFSTLEDENLLKVTRNSSSSWRRIRCYESHLSHAVERNWGK